MELITLQGKVPKDQTDWLVSDAITRSIKLRGIVLPPEMNMQAGWTEVRIKVVRGEIVGRDQLLEAENMTKEILGAGKIYLELNVLTLKCDYFLTGTNYHIVLEVKNGTGNDRLYTAQVWYD